MALHSGLLYLNNIASGQNTQSPDLDCEACVDKAPSGSYSCFEQVLCCVDVVSC